MSELKTNVLYYGDNLHILRHHIPDESIDLVYLDPPFNSKADYNVLFREESGERSAAQIKAFSDFWHWDSAAEETYRDIVETCPDKVATMVSAMRQAINDTDVMAYLVMMTVRLVELRRKLKPAGSLYLHCDPTVSHYLKVVMDTVFGPTSFRNEIVWRRTGSHNQINRFGPIHDTLLFYAKSAGYAFSRIYRPYTKGHVATYFKKFDGRGPYWTNALTGAGTRKGDSGKPWRGWDPTKRGRHWAIPGRIAEELGISDLPLLDKLEAMYRAGFVQLPGPGSKALPTYTQYLADSAGLPAQDIWAYQPHTKGVLHGNSDEGIDEDVRWLTPTDKERLGYQTQKPEGLLERIIRASSNEGDVVLDPFCGCGTAVVAAQKLNRRWIGIDITHLAITVMKERLRDAFSGIEFEVVGEPKDVESARALAAQDRYQFQWWALSLVNARPAGDDRKKGADTGIDGVIGFVEEKGKAARVIVSVKSGGVNVGQVRDLKGVVEREKASIGLFITLEAFTQPMHTEAVSAGFYHSDRWQKDYPKIQILTVEELLAGREPLLPPFSAGGFAKAERISREAAEQRKEEGGAGAVDYTGMLKPRQRGAADE